MAVHIHPPPERPAPSAPQRKGPELPERAVVVDGTDIPARDIAAEMQHHPADTVEDAWNAAAQALVIRQLLRDAAATRGLDPDDEESLDQLLAAEVKIPPMDDDAARRWYAVHPERFGAPDLWEASHILIAADPEDPEARTAAQARAEDILAQLRSDPSLLPALAKLHSDCPSGAEGGHLGQVTRGSTVPEFETALAALQPGQLASAAVPSRYGMHIIQLHAHVPANHLPFEAIAERVAADLRAQSWREGVRQYIAALAASARIEGFELNDGTVSKLQ